MYTLTTSEEKKRKDYAFWRQFIEKPSIITGCPVTTSEPSAADTCERQSTDHSIAVFGDCSFEKIVMTRTHGSHLMCCLYVKLLVCKAACALHGAFLPSINDDQPAEWSNCSQQVQQQHPNPSETCI